MKAPAARARLAAWGLARRAEEEGGEWAEEEAERGEGEREAEEAEGAGVEVEEVAHAEGVVAGVLGEEGGEVGVGGGVWVWRRKKMLAAAKRVPRTRRTAVMRRLRRGAWAFAAMRCVRCSEWQFWFEAESQPAMRMASGGSAGRT